jgi:hypothetical protein
VSEPTPPAETGLETVAQSAGDEPAQPAPSLPSQPQPAEAAEAAPAEVPPTEATPAESAPAAEPPRRRKGRVGAVLMWIAIVIVLALIAYVVWALFLKETPAKAEVGQCLGGTSVTERDANKLKLTDCASSDATFKVIQKFEHREYKDAKDATCTSADTTFVFFSPDQKLMFWQKDGPGTVLCLAQNAPEGGDSGK